VAAKVEGTASTAGNHRTSDDAPRVNATAPPGRCCNCAWASIREGLAHVKVLMLGPGDGVTGGIAALMQVMLPELRRRTELRYLATVRRRALKDSGRLTLRNLGRAVSQYLRFTWALVRFRPEIVHVHTSLGIAWLKDTFFIAAAKAWGSSVIVHVHGGAFDVHHARSSWMLQRYTRAALARASAIIAVSDDMRERIARIAPSTPSFTLRNCVPTDRIPSARSPRHSGDVEVLFIGTVGPSKGAFDLLEALARLRSEGRPLRGRIAGYEEGAGDLERARARQNALGLDGTCEVLGVIDPTQKAQLLVEADVFALPSYAEGLPMALLEAMAAGLAVVATPVGGIGEVVEDGVNGFLVPPGDVRALASALRRLATDVELRAAMGRRNRERAERELDVGPYLAQLLGIYTAVKS
jgi:glycosyltransferase involved in cell wall biosynthesis